MAKTTVPKLEIAQRSFLDAVLPTATVRRIRWSEGETQVIEAGEGPPILFVHGGFTQATDWISLWPHLSRRYRLMAVDRPGHGLADPYDYRGIDTRQLAVRFLADVLDVLGLDQPPIVANSLGGRWSVELALRYPNRVAQLMLAGAPAGSRALVPLSMLAMRWPLTRPIVRRVFRRAEPEGVRAFYGKINVVHPERLAREFLVATAAGQRRNYHSLLSFATRVMTYWSIHPDLLLPDRWPELQVPVHFIWGDGDVFDSPSTGQAAVPQIAGGAEISIVPGAGHLPWLDEPEQVASAIASSLGS
jgi:pimeloyl-ACP methyl ester carboxylesterase